MIQTPANQEPRDTMARMIDGYLLTQMIAVVTGLGIPEHLADGPTTAAELAAKTGAEPHALARVLRGLAAEGVLTEAEPGLFAPTPLSDLLRADSRDSMRGTALARGALYYRAAEGLAQAVRTGGIAFEQIYGRAFFEHLAADPEAMRAFQRSMENRSAQEAAAVCAACDFGRFRTIVDIGGGTGILLSAVLQRWPTVRGVLFDMPDVVAHAREVLENSDLRERIDLVAGDFFTEVPTGGDLYLISRVLHDWDDDTAVRILANCRHSMTNDARLVLIEAVLPQLAQDGPAAIRMDLHMLLLLPGRERTAAEFERLLARAGFGEVRTVPTSSPLGVHVIEARPLG